MVFLLIKYSSEHRVWSKRASFCLSKLLIAPRCIN